MIIIPTREQFITHTHAQNKDRTTHHANWPYPLLGKTTTSFALFVVFGGRSGGSFPPFFLFEKKSSLIFSG